MCVCVCVCGAGGGGIYRMSSMGRFYCICVVLFISLSYFYSPKLAEKRNQRKLTKILGNDS